MSEKNKSSCVPAHKQDDHAKKPGQVTDVVLKDYYDRKAQSYGFDRHPYLRTPNCDPGPKKEVSQKAKLTFEEWYNSGKPSHHADYNDCKAAWEAGQENK